jgi:WD40 repeat protein
VQSIFTDHPKTMNSPRKILFLGSNPKNKNRKRSDEEFREISEAWKLAKNREQFSLQQQWAVDTTNLRRAMLDEKPQIVHFSGHGKNKRGLIFEDKCRGNKLVDSNAIAELFRLFKDENLKCVVLNGCYSGEQAKEIAKHIPYVIGMNRIISDKSLIRFAVSFYDTLGAGHGFQYAFDHGCVAILMEKASEAKIPVFYEKGILIKGDPEKHKNGREFIPLSTRISLVISLIILIGGGLFMDYYFKLNRATSLASSSQLLVKEGQHINALIDGIKAGRILQNEKSSDMSVLVALQTALDKKQEFNRLEGHNDTVRSVSFNSDSSLVASGSYDKTVKIWNAKTGKEVPISLKHDESVISISFHPTDRNILVTGSKDGIIRIWDIEKGDIKHKLPKYSNINSVKFSPNGNMLAAAATTSKDGKAKGIVAIWKKDSEGWKHVKDLNVNGEIAWTIDFDKFSEKLVAGNGNKNFYKRTSNTIQVWNLKDKKELEDSYFSEKASVLSAVFNPTNSDVLATSGVDGTIKIWDLKTKKPPKVLKRHDKYIYSIAYSQDGKTIASASLDGKIKIWTSKNGEPDYELVDTLNGNNGELYSLTFANISKSILLESEAKNTLVLASGGANKAVNIWHLNSSDMKHDLSVTSLDFSSDGESLLSGSIGENSIKLWNVKDKEEKDSRNGSNENKEVTAITFNPFDGETFAVRNVDKNNNIRFYQYDKREKISSLSSFTDLDQREVKPPTYPMSYSLDGKKIASGSGNKTIKIWDTKKESAPTELEKQRGDILDVKYGKGILASSNNYGRIEDDERKAYSEEKNIIKVWDIDKNKVIFSLKDHKRPVNSLSFNPFDYNLLASGSRDNTVKIWDLTLKKLIWTSHKQDDQVRIVTFTNKSNNKELLAAGLETGEIKIWDVKTKEEIHSIKSHKKPVLALKFSPDNKILASGSQDKSIKLWDTSMWGLKALVKHSCDWVANYLENNPNVKSEDKFICKSSQEEKKVNPSLPPTVK